MKKRITLLFLSVALVFVLIPAVSVPVSAAPSSDNIVQQMGGPVSSKFSLNIEDIIKRYTGWQIYEARLYPFGEGEGMPVFIGTAQRTRDISKTDAEIAYLDAMEKAGTDEYSLKKFLSYVKKYEATCTVTAGDIEKSILDGLSTATGTGSMVLDFGDSLAANGVNGAIAGVGLANNAVGIYRDIQNDNVSMDTVITGAFTLGDLAGLAGGVLSIGVLSTIGTVAAVGGVGYTTFQKYMEHQEQWKDFANYLTGRRNLVEFFKYLDVELAEAMENSTGWDIQFNNAEATYDNSFLLDKSLKVPITMTLTARFMHNYVSEFEFGKVRHPNEDGWAGNLDMSMEADFEQFMTNWPHSNAIGLTQDTIEQLLWTYGIVDKNELSCKTPFTWHSSLQCVNFPLKTNSLSEEQSQIVFTGDLGTGNYNYRQSGEMVLDFDATQGVIFENGERHSGQIHRHYEQVLMTQDGVKTTRRVYHYHSGAFETDSKPLVDNYAGDAFGIEYLLKDAKMVIDMTNLKGGEDDGEKPTYCHICGAALSPENPYCSNCNDKN